jgi:proteasome lid subunit RPN8/RPN11
MEDSVSTRIDVSADSVIDAIVAYGKRAAPKEACGVILSDGRVVELPNISVTPENAYVMRGEDLEAALIEQMPDGEHLVHYDFVVWHTHPSGQIGPSPADMHTRVHGIQYLVVSWQDVGDCEVEAFPTLYSCGGEMDDGSGI